MVFRLPTHLESFVPPPSQQVPDQRPWRGALTVSGMRTSDNSQTVRVTAVETDGDNRADLWPSQFYTQIIQRPVLKDLQAWVKRHTPPLCTFIPDRHRDPNINVANQTTFRSLSRFLFENQTAAVASWGSDDIPGAGIIIFPAQNSSSLLVGASFLTNAFPEFITRTPSSPALLQSTYGSPFQQSISSYVVSSHHHESTSSQQPMLYTTSHVDHLGSANRQHHYRYALPRTHSSDRAPLSSDPVWPDVKNEEDGDYPTNSPPTHDSHYPQTG